MEEIASARDVWQLDLELKQVGEQQYSGQTKYPAKDIVEYIRLCAKWGGGHPSYSK